MYNKVDGRLMQAGDRFEFGRYPQGSNGEEKPITWRVLRHDSDSLLVIADMGLDCKRYHELECSITWSNCTLRRWLNDEFYRRAFNGQEQSLVKKTTLANNAGPMTEDNIFLLSFDDAKNLFSNNNDRICKPTEYAIKNGVSTYKGNVYWWLRSRRHHNSLVAFVLTDGSIRSCNVDYEEGFVRPAFQIAI